VIEKRALKKIFRRKRDEVTGGWRKLRNEKLHNLDSSPSDEVKEDEMGTTRSMNVGKRGVHVGY
jgi:hypothetical protein